MKEINLLQKELSLLTEKVKTLEKENNDLEKLIALLEDREVQTFQNGRYTNELREVIMELVSLNVSMNKMNDVISCVVRKLGNKEIGRLPSAGMKARLMHEALLLSQNQVAEAMMETDGMTSGNCLHGDGTTKYHKHYQNFQITTTSGKL